MKDIISLTDFKNDASGWIKRLQNQPPVVLTQNGRAAVVVQSYESYQQMCDSLAMLTIVARGEADIRGGRTTSQEKVFADLRHDLQMQGGARAKGKKARA